MRPSKRGKVREQGVGNGLAAQAQVIQRAADIDGVPERDRRRDQGEPARAMLLRLCRAVALAAEPMETNRLRAACDDH